MTKLFEAKKRLYPQSIKGRFRRIKNILNPIFLSIFLFSPFLRWSRGIGAPDQAILINFSDSKIYFFALEIWPQETVYLAAILVIAAVALFFVTSLFGRVWCGYACFQTVWTDIFIALERFFQGDRNNRILLDRRNSFAKLWRKSATHFCWILISLITGFGFVCYFNDAFELLRGVALLEFSFNVAGWILGIAGATYIMAGFAREHVCTYMCPYSRFQSAMFDENTLVITYDQKRGEPRTKLKADDVLETRGDCIDCKMCVVVCPTGIDIRNGLQMECIACGLCVDACDNVMEKIGRPKGLIRYDTEKNLLNPSPQNRFKFLKPRTFWYVAILSIVSGLLIFSLSTKSVLEVDAIPDRNPLFVTLSDGSVRNGYTLKIMNKTYERKNFTIEVLSPKEAQLKLQSFEEGKTQNISVDQNSVATLKIFVILPRDFLTKNSEGRSFVDLLIKDESSLEVKKIQAVFVSSNSN